MKRPEINGWAVTTNENGIKMATLPRDTMVEILKYVEYADKQLRLGAVVVSEERAELCDNPNCEDGIVDRDYYGHPIYCQVCESHN